MAQDLHRYTDLPGLFYMLQRKRLAILDPQTWEDRNDAYFMAVYKDAKRLSCLLALCFSTTSETYHHWKVFAHGTSGVRVTFDRKALTALLDEYEGIRTGMVEYKLLDDIRDEKPTVEGLPFLKRSAYRHEEEFRVIYESKIGDQSPVYIPLPLACIRKISLSPWMNPRLAKPVIRTVRSIAGCEAINIYRSTLISNDEWKSYGDEAIGIKTSTKEITALRKKTNLRVSH